MNNRIVLKLADFSKFPSGRDMGDGDYNGEKYREEVLAPSVELALRSGKKLEVSLEGVLNFGSSFMEEAFGGLVRKKVISKKDLRSILKISPETPYFDRYRKLIFQHIDDAKPE